MQIKIIPPRPPQSHKNPLNPSIPIPDSSPKATIDAPAGSRQDRIMEKFKQAVFALAAADPSRPLTPEKKALIDRRLHELRPIAASVPSHPTYSSMIYRAITELNEEGGSSVESILEFTRREYDDLPWAHLGLLSHHLGKLCENGEIVVSASGGYSISSLEFAPAWKPKRKKLKKRRREMCWKRRKRGKRKPTDAVEKVEGVEEENLKHAKEEDEKGNVVGEGNLGVEKIRLVKEENKLCREDVAAEQSKERKEEKFDGDKRKLRWARQGQCRDEEPKQQDEMQISSLDEENGKHVKRRKGRLSKFVVIEEEDESFELVQKRKREQQHTRLKQSNKDVVEESQGEQVEGQNQPIELTVVEKEEELAEGKNDTVEEQNKKEQQAAVIGEKVRKEKQVGVTEKQGRGPAVANDVIENQHLGEVSRVGDRSGDESPRTVMGGEGNEALEQQTESLIRDWEHPTKEQNEVFDTQNQIQQDNVAIGAISPYGEKEFAVIEAVKSFTSEQVQLQKQKLEVSMLASLDKPNSSKQAEQEQSEGSKEKNGYPQSKLPIGKEAMTTEINVAMDQEEVLSNEISLPASFSLSPRPPELILPTMESSQEEQQQQIEVCSERVASPSHQATVTTDLDLLANLQKHENEREVSPPLGFGMLPTAMLDADTTKGELLSSDCSVVDDKQKQQQPLKARGRRGRPPKPKQEAEEIGQEFLSSDHLHSEQRQQQQPHQGRGRGRGRPPKPKAEERGQGRGRGRGRPPKPKAEEDYHIDKQQQQPRVQGRGWGRGRGRGRAAEQNLATINGELPLPSQEKEQVQSCRRGRPPKRKPVADFAMDDSALL